jgi:hypothetical protein
MPVLQGAMCGERRQNVWVCEEHQNDPKPSDTKNKKMSTLYINK